MRCLEEYICLGRLKNKFEIKNKEREIQTMKQTMKALILAGFITALGAYISHAAVVLQGRKVSFAASIYSAKEARNKNYNGRLVLSRANVYYQALLKFDLKPLGDKKVKDAAIFLYAKKQYYKRPMIIEVFRVTSDWKSDEVNYNRCREGVNWKTKGGDKDELPIARLEVKGEFINGWVLIRSKELTELVNKWLDGSSPNYGLLFRPAFKYRGQTMKMFSAGSKDKKDKLPKLVVSYEKNIVPADFGVIDAVAVKKDILRGYLDKVIVKISKDSQRLQEKVRFINNKINSLESGNKLMIAEIETEIKRLRLDTLKELFQGKAIKAWKIGPWENMSPWQYPAVGTVAVEGVMLKNEYLELSAGISNISTQKQIVKIAVDVKKSGISPKALQLRVSYWVKALLLKEDQRPGKEKYKWVDDVLPLLSNNEYATLQAGENRRIWLTVDSSKIESGTYSFALKLKNAEGETGEIPVKLTVLPVQLQRDLDLAVYTYAYLNRRSTSRFKEFAVRDLQKHYQNTFVLNLLPKYNAANGTADFSAIINYIKYIPKDAKKLMFFWNCESGKVPFCAAKNWGSDEWKNTLRKVVLQWYAELEKAGFSAEQVVMYPFDETYDNSCCNTNEYKALADVAAELHTVNPKIQIFMDPVAFREIDLKIMRGMAKNIDIWAPVQDLYKPGNYKGWPRDYSLDEKLAVRKLFEQQQGKGKLLWTYQCHGPSRVLDVNSYYRRIAWNAWLFKVSGLGLWSYNDVRGASGWSDKDRGDFSLIYELRDAPATIPTQPYEPLIPSRRWQMWRTAVQDYYLLQQAAQKAGRKEIETVVKEVLLNSDSSDSYEKGRRKLHKILLER